MTIEMPKPHVDLLQQLINGVLTEEVTQFSSDPMIVEFGIACKFLADLIKKVPKQFQPALVAALVAVIETQEGTATALVNSFPTVIHPLTYAGKVMEVPPAPVTLTQQFIVAQGTLLQEYVVQEVLG